MNYLIAHLQLESTTDGRGSVKKKKKENISFQRQWCQGFIYIWKVFLTSLCNWSVAPLVLNADEGRPQGMAVLESVHLCIHSEWVTALYIYLLIFPDGNLSSVSNVVRTVATAQQCLVWREQAAFWSEIPWLADIKSCCCHSAVSLQNEGNPGCSKKKPYTQECSFFWAQCSIEINATEHNNWEKCDSLRFPWNHWFCLGQRPWISLYPSSWAPEVGISA